MFKTTQISIECTVLLVVKMKSPSRLSLRKRSGAWANINNMLFLKRNSSFIVTFISIREMPCYQVLSLLYFVLRGHNLINYIAFVKLIASNLVVTLAIGVGGYLWGSLLLILNYAKRHRSGFRGIPQLPSNLDEAWRMECFVEVLTANPTPANRRA